MWGKGACAGKPCPPLAELCDRCVFADEPFAAHWDQPVLHSPQEAGWQPVPLRLRILLDSGGCLVHREGGALAHTKCTGGGGGVGVHEVHAWGGLCVLTRDARFQASAAHACFQVPAAVASY